MNYKTNVILGQSSVHSQNFSQYIDLDKLLQDVTISISNSYESFINLSYEIFRTSKLSINATFFNLQESFKRSRLSLYRESFHRFIDKNISLKQFAIQKDIVDVETGEHLGYEKDRIVHAFDSIARFSKYFVPTDQRALSITHALNTRDTNKRYCLGIDWLTLRLFSGLCLSDFEENEPRKDFGKYSLVLRGYGTQHFRAIADVYFDGELIGLYAFDGNKNTHLGKSLFTVKNNVFYSGERVGDLVLGFCKETGFSYDNITRLDIALDGYDLRPVLNQYARKEVDKLGFSQVRLIEFDRDEQAFQAAYIGSRRSKRFLRAYDKSKELKKSGKQYIYDSLAASGLDPENVYRTELQFNTSYFSDLVNKVMLDDLDSQDFLACLFYDNITDRKFCDFIPLGDINKSRRASLGLWEFLKTLNPRSFIKKAKRVTDGVRTKKIILKRMLKDAYKASSDYCDLYLSGIAAILYQNPFIFSWFRLSYPRMMDEARNEVSPFHIPFYKYDSFDDLEKDLFSLYLNTSANVVSS